MHTYLNIHIAIVRYLTIVSPLLDGSCPPGWHYYNGNCFYTSTITANQPTARTRCQAMDADLASISNQAEMDFVNIIS